MQGFWWARRESVTGSRLLTRPSTPARRQSRLRHSTPTSLINKNYGHLTVTLNFHGGREGSRTLISLRTKDFKSFVYTIPPLALKRGCQIYLAPPEGVGHRFAPADAPVDPGSAPSCLRRSTLKNT